MIFVIKFLAGILIGVANVIPGVSGGTIAVILNVYEDLLTLTSLDFKKIFANFKTLFFLCIGVLVGVLVFAKLVTIAYEKFPIYTNFFFTGIILGSIPFVFTIIKNSDTEKPASLIVKLIAFVLSLSLMLVLFFANRSSGSIENSLIELSLKQGAFLFLVGFIAAIAMLIPGISGSFLLLILGYYKTVINAVSTFNIPILFIFGCGVLLGLVLASRVLMYVLKKFGDIVYSAIFGLLLGSILPILPLVNQPPLGFVISGLCLLAGATLILVFTYMNKRTDVQSVETL